MAIVALAGWNIPAARVLARWRESLGLMDRRIRLQPTHPMQITGPNGVPGHHLVGVIVDGKVATIVHTRRLREEDIIHELLHVARPDWPHVEVELWTDLLRAEPALAAVVRDGDRLEKSAAYGSGGRITEPQPLEQVMSLRKEGPAGMKEVTAYNLKTKKRVTMLDPKLVTLKNGRKALRGLAGDDRKTTVVKILGAKSLAEWEQP